MKKITLLFLLLISIVVQGQQTCSQSYSILDFYENSPVLTVNSSDFNCYDGTLNSITISDVAFEYGYCVDENRNFELNLDGVITRICPLELIGMDLTNFSNLTISSNSAYGGFGFGLAILITANYSSQAIPLCNSVMTHPVDGATNLIPNNIDLTFSPASNATGYNVTVGTNSGGNNILNVDVPANMGNNYTLNLPNLAFGTEYFVNIIPYNQNGIATDGCTEYTFSTISTNDIPGGATCQKPIQINLPYYTINNLTNFGSEYYTGDSGCNNGVGAFSGGEAIYSYTATFTGSINVQYTHNVAGAAIFIYDDCADIGFNCLASANDWEDLDFGEGWFQPMSINAFPVIEGTTYYFLLTGSLYPNYPPNLITDYSLNIAANSCSNPVVKYELNSAQDCNVSQQFYINVDVTDMGDASSIILSDNQNSPTQILNSLGAAVFGPYANGTEVSCKAQNSGDENCYVKSRILTQGSCGILCDQPTNVPIGEVITAEFSGGLGSIFSPVYSIYELTGSERLFAFTPPVTGKYRFTALSQEIIGGTTPPGDIFMAFIKPADDDCKKWGLPPVTNYWSNGSSSSIFFGDDLIAGVTYWLLIDSTNLNETTPPSPSIATFKIDKECTPPVVSSSLVSGCPIPEFSIDISVSSMGNSTELTIVDNLNGSPQVITGTGVFTFGPYANGQTPIFTVTGTGDLTECDPITTVVDYFQVHCPGVNDLCENAFDLECNVSFYTETTQNSGIEDEVSCVETVGDDVWYKFTGAGIEERILMSNPSEQVHYIEVYESSSNSCSGFTLGNCVANITSTYDNQNSFSLAIVTLNTILDKTYYVRVGSINENSINFYIERDCLGNQTVRPVNDNLCDAIDLIVDEPIGDTIYTTVDGTEQIGEPIPSCFNQGIDGSVWFKFVAPNSGNVKITTDLLGDGFYTLRDTEIAVYEATNVDCSNLSTLGSSLGCDQDSGVLEFFNSILYLDSLLPGNTYYIQVDKWGHDFNSGTFGIEVLDMGTLVTSTVDQQRFLVYPNPVKNILNLSYNRNIEKVLVYNLLGQEVAAKSNADNTQIDMSSLASGTYLVKISSGDKVKTIKVIKD